MANLCMSMWSGTMLLKLLMCVVLLLNSMAFCKAGVKRDYVTYVKTAENKFEPALEAISSTVEPVPMYKLLPKLYQNVEDEEDYDKDKLLTIFNIKKMKKERKPKEYDTDVHYVKIEPYALSSMT